MNCVLHNQGFFEDGGGGTGTCSCHELALADEPTAEPFLLQGGTMVLVPSCICMQAKEKIKKHNVL
jgi:hypothetical protein